LAVTGAVETKKALEGLKKSTARGVLERVLKRAAKAVEAGAKSNAPVLTGELRKSISTKIIRNSAGKRAYAAAMASGASSAEAGLAARAANRTAAGAGLTAVARVSATAPHAHLVELGTQSAPAQPFLAPALRAANPLTDIKTDIAREVVATAKRVAARAAKKGTA
jgi:HK97 gp10 family phage protein